MKEKIKKFFLTVALIISATSILWLPILLITFSDELAGLNETIANILIILGVTLPFVFAVILFEKLNLKRREKEIEKLLIEKIRKEWEEEQNKNWLTALEKFPSKHLVGNEKEWEEMIEKQGNYFAELNKISAKKIQEKYNLSVEDWRNLEAQFHIDEMERLMKNPKYKEIMEKIKKMKNERKN